MNIPDEAVEVAAWLFYRMRYPVHVATSLRQVGKPIQDECRMDAAAFLDAVAPLIAAQALREASDAYPLETAYGGAEHAVIWLKERADQIEAAADAAASVVEGEK